MVALVFVSFCTLKPETEIPAMATMQARNPKDDVLCDWNVRNACLAELRAGDAAIIF